MLDPSGDAATGCDGLVGDNSPVIVNGDVYAVAADDCVSPATAACCCIN